VASEKHVDKSLLLPARYKNPLPHVLKLIGVYCCQTEKSVTAFFVDQFSVLSGSVTLSSRKLDDSFTRKIKTVDGQFGRKALMSLIMVVCCF